MDRAAWYAAFVAGFCPLCRRGPWKSLARHMTAAHDVTAAELARIAHGR